LAFLGGGVVTGKEAWLQEPFFGSGLQSRVGTMYGYGRTGIPVVYLDSARLLLDLFGFPPFYFFYISLVLLEWGG